MIMVTVLLSILNQMEFHLVQNRKENCHYDHIPFNVKGNGRIVFSVRISPPLDVPTIAIAYRHHASKDLGPSLKALEQHNNKVSIGLRGGLNFPSPPKKNRNFWNGCWKIIPVGMATQTPPKQTLRNQKKVATSRCHPSHFHVQSLHFHFQNLTHFFVA